MNKTLEQHNYHGIDATIIADSKNEHGQRITSFVCTFPRIVLAEFNTHRMISRNSASSRAVPFKRMIKDIQEHPFIPIRWMKDHKGMQGTEYFSDTDPDGFDSIRPATEILKRRWLNAKDSAVHNAQILSESNLTKQLVNRLLEPFKWHTVICTGTEWENFFALRAHEEAEIHIQALAYKMLEEYNESTPKQLKAGEWHIPFGDQFSETRLYQLRHIDEKISTDDDVQSVKVKIATARCARVSYENFEGGDDYEKDIKLYDRLASMGHWSPFEHCARAMTEDEILSNIKGKMLVYISVRVEDAKHLEGVVDNSDLGWSGNFRGFIQLRKLYENESRKDNRVKK